MPGTASWTSGGQEWEEPLEVDFAHDPTMAECCVREIKQNRKHQQRMDAVRKGMPSALVRKDWITSISEHGSGYSGPDAERTEENEAIRERHRLELGDDERTRSGDEGADSDDIDALLADVDDDLEMVQIRDARVNQLRSMAQTAQKRQSEEKITSCGELIEVSGSQLLPLVHSERRLVALLCGYGSRDTGGEDDDEPAHIVVARHLRVFAPRYKGTVFVAVTLTLGGGEEEAMVLQRTVRCDALPAVVCFRDGVIVARSCGRLHQFVQMGEVGQAVFRAWLNQTKVLREKEEDEREQVRGGSGSDDEQDDAPKIRSPNKGVVRAVFQSRGDAGGTCVDPNCKHLYQHEHLRRVQREEDSGDELQD